MSDPTAIKFNINQHVRVKLTDYGRAAHRQAHKAFWQSAGRPMEYRPPKEDAEGWSKWQLWALMQAFGPHMGLGLPNVFETEIELLPGT